MTYVQSELRTVYKARGLQRSFLTSHAAYYNAAKRMVCEKYPRELTDEDRFRPGHVMTNAEVSRLFGIGLANVPCRRRKRRRLFYDDVCDCSEDETHGPECGYFDADRWSAFVRRVARFLKFVDGCEVAS